MALQTFENDAYRYGFQGQEKDDDWKGQGASYNYKYRVHDARLGRFFSVDPMAVEFPFYSPYAFSGNHVIHATELEGLESDPVNVVETEPTYGAGDGILVIDQGLPPELTH